MTAIRTGLITIAIVSLSGQLHAADPAASRVDELRSAQERVARAANQTKGGPQQLLLLEQRKLSGLIDDLENGRHVDSQEIDRALQRAEQGTP